jgi:ribosomal protein L37AE/L43A
MTITVEQMKQLDEDLDQRVSEGTFAEGRGQKNAYVCENCGRAMTTINRNAGTTPMWKACYWCGSDATSCMYRINQNAPALFEWYRPMSEEEIAEVLQGDDKYGYYSEYIGLGGLAFRKIPLRFQRRYG